MRCEVHCPDGGGALAGAVAVAALVFVFAVVASVAAAVVASVAEASAVAALAVCGVLSWPTWRLVKYGDRREVFPRHRKVRAAVVRRPAITTGQAMIEAGRIEVTPDMVLGKVKEGSR